MNKKEMLRILLKPKLSEFIMRSHFLMIGYIKLNYPILTTDETLSMIFSNFMEVK